MLPLTQNNSSNHHPIPALGIPTVLAPLIKFIAKWKQC
jgi:hypothetical protein